MNNIEQYKDDQNIIAAMENNETAEDENSEYLIIIDKKRNDYVEMEYGIPQQKRLVMYYESKEILRKILIYRDIYLLNFIHSGNEIFDKSGHLIKTYKLLAESYLESKRLNENRKFIYRFNITDKLHKAEKKITLKRYDETAALFELHSIFNKAIKIYGKFLNNNNFMNKCSLIDIQKSNQSAYKKAELFLKERIVEKKILYLQSFVTILFDEYGGLTPERWKIGAKRI